MVRTSIYTITRFSLFARLLAYLWSEAADSDF